MQDEGCEKAWRGLIKFRSLEEEACETRSHASEKRMLLGRYLSCGYHEAGSANSEKLQTKSICCKGTELLLPVTHSYRKQTGGWEDTANSSPASSLPVSRYCSLLTQPNGSSWQKGTVAHRQGYVQYPKTAYWMMDLEVRDNDFLSGIWFADVCPNSVACEMRTLHFVVGGCSQGWLRITLSVFHSVQLMVTAILPGSPLLCSETESQKASKKPKQSEAKQTKMEKNHL